MKCSIPMGWDAFGMPAENAAIGKGVHPVRMDPRQYRGDEGDQTKTAGLCPGLEHASWQPAMPDYYGQEQALFIDMFEGGLVYRKESPP